MDIEPFGYFRALPIGWEDCGENDEGAMPLYEQKTIDEILAIIKQREEDCEHWYSKYEAAWKVLAGEDR